MKTQLFSLALLSLPCLGGAQVSQKVSRLFPAHIVYRIEDVNSKIKLSEDKQIKIGQKLYTADSLANVSLTKNEPVSKLKSYYTIDSHFLKPILSPEELDYYGSITDRDNRYLTALTLVSHLKLNPSQISEIRKKNDSLANVPKISSKETIRIYNKNLLKILSKEQYISVLKTIYHEQSVDEAQKDWAKIKKLQLVSDKDEKPSTSKF